MSKAALTFVSATILALSTQPAHAINGEVLWDWCRRGDPETLNYVSGVVDTLMEVSDGKVNNRACVSGGTSRRSVEVLTCSYLANNPEARDYRGAMAVIAALEKSYCRK